ncbi:hypothetical protein JXI42_07650 [bacterium]|nr:hypothetical protein [bacterium]
MKKTIILLVLLSFTLANAKFEYPLNLQLGMGGAKSYSFRTQITARTHRDFPFPWFDSYINGAAGLDYLFHGYEDSYDSGDGNYNRALLYFTFGNLEGVRDLFSLGFVCGVYYASFPGFEAQDVLFGMHLNTDYSFLWEPDYFTVDWLFLMGEDYVLTIGKMSLYIYRGFGIYAGFSYDGYFDHFGDGDYDHALVVNGGIEYNIILKN